MTISFDAFVSQYTRKRKDGSVRILGDYKDRFGEMSFEDAYNSEIKRRQKIKDRSAKIRDFENFLMQHGARCEQSRISESRYYYHKGVKYRFSGHIYPTGSMTDDTLAVIDLAANPERIDDIIF